MYILIFSFICFLIFFILFFLTQVVLEGSFKKYFSKKSFFDIIILVIIVIIVSFVVIFDSKDLIKKENYIKKLNQLKSEEVMSISFYKTNSCDLIKKKEKILTINDEKEIKSFLNNYFGDLKIKNERFFYAILMLEIKKKNEIFNFCIRYGQKAWLILDSIEDITISVSSYKLKYFLKNLNWE